jgi:hypothetical protein
VVRGGAVWIFSVSFASLTHRKKRGVAGMTGCVNIGFTLMDSEIAGYGSYSQYQTK